MSATENGTIQIDRGLKGKIEDGVNPERVPGPSSITRRNGREDKETRNGFRVRLGILIPKIDELERSVIVRNRDFDIEQRRSWTW
jgi:hypothetical protein